MHSIPHWRISDRDRRSPDEAEREWSSVWSDGEGLQVSVAGQRKIFRLDFVRGGVFDVDTAQRRITAFAHSDDIPASTVSLLLADQVAPRILAHEGELVVHGSAIAADDRAVVFTGDSGLGKSTLAASFGQSGLPVICDDAIQIGAVDAVPVAQPLSANLRLHADSLKALYPAIEAHSTIAHHGLKRRFTRPQNSTSESKPPPIAAIFAILPEGPAATIAVRPMSAARLCMALVSNSFSLNPADLQVAGERLRKAGLVAERVRAFSLAYPRSYDLLPDVRAAVLDAVRNLGGD